MVAVAAADAAAEVTVATAVAAATEAVVATNGAGQQRERAAAQQWHAINRDRVPYVEYLYFFLTNSFPT